jgi:ABC-2 type transport system ATP-binding protein
MAEMRKLIKQIGQGNRTVLLSSHLLPEVEQICDRVGVIRGGKLVTESTVQALLGKEGILVKAEPVDRAFEMLKGMFGDSLVSRQNGSIRLETDPARSLDVNSRLMAAGIAVSELRPVERSLEEAFFQLTGEKQGS